MARSNYLANLRARGFDLSTYRALKYYPRCSQCQATVINGTACHETGCSNARHECKGCTELIPVRQKYCEECS